MLYDASTLTASGSISVPVGAGGTSGAFSIMQHGMILNQIIAI